MDDRWQLNDETFWEEEPSAGPEPGPEPADDLLDAQDPEGVVTVYVIKTGEVRSVKLTDDWKTRTDPRRLSTHVVSAANAATMAATAAQAEIAQSATIEPPREPAGGVAASDDSPITAAEALQLIDTVSADLEAFNRQVLAVAETVVSAESGGRHVQGTARQGQILEIVVDAGWCGTARNAEIESELTDVLKALRTKSSAAELARGPQSPAISQLQALASDPQRLLRRLGLTDQSDQHGRRNV